MAAVVWSFQLPMAHADTAQFLRSVTTGALLPLDIFSLGDECVDAGVSEPKGQSPDCPSHVSRIRCVGVSLSLVRCGCSSLATKSVLALGMHMNVSTSEMHTVAVNQNHRPRGTPLTYRT